MIHPRKIPSMIRFDSFDDTEFLKINGLSSRCSTQRYECFFRRGTYNSEEGISISLSMFHYIFISQFLHKSRIDKFILMNNSFEFPNGVLWNVYKFSTLCDVGFQYQVSHTLSFHSLHSIIGTSLSNQGKVTSSE